jgi:FkbM family methyltransferase
MNLTSMLARLERGHMRRMPPGVVLAANAMLHQRLGEAELHELPRLIRPGSIAVDVGAHFGTFSVPMARLVGKQGRVISIEPIAEDAELLERGARALRLPITVLNCALSSSEGEAELHVPLLGGSQKTALSSLEATTQAGDAGYMETRTVRTRTLDEVLGNVDLPVSFVKIDVEGHELDVLRGAERTLRAERPHLLIEINNDLGDRPVEDVFEFILSFGYRGEFLEEGRYRRPLSAFDVQKHQVAAAGNVLSKAYVNNFIFLPGDQQLV